MKASDFSCIPLCAKCHTLDHDSYHRAGRKAMEARLEQTFAEICKGLFIEWGNFRDS